MSGKYLDETGLLHLWNKIKDLQSALGGGGGSKEELFRDVWNAACGVFGRYNEETGFYELNGLTDLTYEDAMLVFTESNSRNLISPSPNLSDSKFESAQYTGIKARTIFPSVCDACDYYNGLGGGYIKNKVIIANSNIESITLLDENKTTPNRETKEGAIQVTTTGPAIPSPLIYNCPNLKSINAVISFVPDEPISADYFQKCPNLEECCICNDSKYGMGVSFSTCPKISWQSLYYSRMNSTYWSKVTTSLHSSMRDKFDTIPFFNSNYEGSNRYDKLEYIGYYQVNEEEAILFLNSFKEYFGNPIYTDEEAISKICNVIKNDEFGNSIGYGTIWSWVREIDDPLYIYNINVGDVITRCSINDLKNTNHPWHNIGWSGLFTNEYNNDIDDTLNTLDIDTVKIIGESFVDNDLKTAMTYIVTKIEDGETGDMGIYGSNIHMIPVCALSPISVYAPSSANVHNISSIYGVNCKTLPWSWVRPKLLENSSTISYSLH